MPNLILPFIGNRPPTYPFYINGESTQAKGLVAAWSFSGGVSPLVIDHVGQHTLTVTGPLGFVYDPTLNAPVISNNGSQAYLSAPLSPDFDFFNYSFAITFWVNTTNTGFQVFASTISNNDFSGWEVASGVYNPGSVAIWNGADWVETIPTINDGKWHHVGIVFNNFDVHSVATFVIYIDGIAVTNYLVDGNPNTPAVNNPTVAGATQFYIGNREDLGTDFIIGSLADFRIYKLQQKTAGDIWQMWDPATRWDLYRKPPVPFNAPATTAYTYTATGGLAFSNTATATNVVYPCVYIVIPSGTTNGTCASCTSIAGTYTLHWDNATSAYITSGMVCGHVLFSVPLNNGLVTANIMGGDNQYVAAGFAGSFPLSLGSSGFSAFGYCSTYPATITVFSCSTPHYTYTPTGGLSTGATTIHYIQPPCTQFPISGLTPGECACLNLDGVYSMELNFTGLWYDYVCFAPATCGRGTFSEMVYLDSDTQTQPVLQTSKHIGLLLELQDDVIYEINGWNGNYPVTLTLNPSPPPAFCGNYPSTITVSMCNPPVRFTYAGSGTLSWSNGASASVKPKYTYSASGSLYFSNSAPALKGVIYKASGSLHWSNSAPAIRILRYTASGSLHWSNSATVKPTRKYTASGSLYFSNSATATQTGVKYTYSASGSLYWSGSARGTPTIRYTPSGSLHWSNTAPKSLRLSWTPTGGLRWSNAATVKPKYLWKPAGGCAFSNGYIPPAKIYIYDIAKGTLSIGGTSPALLVYYQGVAVLIAQSRPNETPQCGRGNALQQSRPNETPQNRPNMAYISRKSVETG